MNISAQFNGANESVQPQGTQRDGDHQWRAGFGITSDPEWMRIALGSLPEHFVEDVRGYRLKIWGKDDLLSRFPDVSINRDKFNGTYVLEDTGSIEDTLRLFFWKLDTTQQALINDLNFEGKVFQQKQVTIPHFGQDTAVVLDTVPLMGVGREPTRDDPVHLNTPEFNYWLAGILRDAYFPGSQVEGVQVSSSGKERG